MSEIIFKKGDLVSPSDSHFKDMLKNMPALRKKPLGIVLKTQVTEWFTQHLTIMWMCPWGVTTESKGYLGIHFICRGDGTDAHGR